MKFRSLVLIVSVFCGLGLSQSTHQGATHEFALHISSSKAAFHVGEPVQISIKLSNMSDHDLAVTSVTSQGIDMAYQYHVKGPTGDLTEKSDQSRGKVIQHLLTKTIAANESGPDQEVVLNRLFDLQQPGRYVVSVSRRASPDNNADVIQSNELTITLVQ